MVNILLQSEFLWKLIAIVLQMRDEIHRTYAAYLCKRLLAKVCLTLQKYKLHVAAGLNLPWYKSMEWNMEETFSMEWKKIASMEYGKIVFHSIPCPAIRLFTVTSYLVKLYVETSTQLILPSFNAFKIKPFVSGA